MEGLVYCKRNEQYIPPANVDIRQDE